MALTLCFAGLRTQEALQLDFRRVSWQRRALFIDRTKTGRARTVPMHERVHAALERIWIDRKRPESGHVFLSHPGKPYRDTRGKGGNPIAKAHGSACSVAGITDFRVHDWRHHWASWMVMTGCDLSTLMRLAG